MSYFKDKSGKLHYLENDDFTDLLPNGSLKITDAEAAQIEGQKSPEEILQLFTTSIQKHLDDFARTRNYDGILSAATYATSAVPKFKAEGQYAVAARDNTWAAAYALLADVEAGTRPMPTLEEVLAELPALVWPQ